MTAENFDILLVEDNPGDARLVRETLKTAWGSEGNVVDVGTMKDASRALDRGEFDVILLDLMLPDSQGLVTLDNIRKIEKRTPVIVLTGFGDTEIGIQAVQKGAQDYLTKSEITPELLTRAITYSVERVRLLVELENARIREQHEREQRALERLGQGPGGADTQRVQTPSLFSREETDRFETLVGEYEKLLEQSTDEAILGIETIIAKGLRRIAATLGDLKATQYDIIQLHVRALRNRIEKSSPDGAQQVVEEARQMVLELMGYVLSDYRDRLSFPTSG